MKQKYNISAKQLIKRSPDFVSIISILFWSSPETYSSFIESVLKAKSWKQILTLWINIQYKLYTIYYAKSYPTWVWAIQIFSTYEIKYLIQIGGWMDHSLRFNSIIHINV